MIHYFENKRRDPRDSFKLLQKQNTRNPEILTSRFFKIPSKIKRKKSPEFSQITSKQNTRDPRDSFKVRQKQNKRDPEILSNYFKTKTQRAPRFFWLTSKTRQGISEILINYFKNKPQGAQRIFQTTSRTKYKEPRNSFDLFQKQDEGFL